MVYDLAMFKDKRINLLIGVGLSVAVIGLLMFNFSSVTVINQTIMGEASVTTTFNGFMSIVMLFQVSNLASISPDVFAMGIISLVTLAIAVAILVLIALYAMYKKNWILIVYNILMQLMFLGIIAFIAPFVIAESRGYTSGDRYTVVNISIHAAQIIMWAVGAVGCFMATAMSYANKSIAFALYFAGGLGLLIVPFFIIVVSRKDKKIKQLEAEGHA